MACPTGKLRVVSRDPRVNYNLLPGEKLLTCPYNPSHAVLPLKFCKHVLNCHKLHERDQKAKGEEGLFAICQFDRSHHVRKEHIKEHESTCESDPAKQGEDDWEWQPDYANEGNAKAPSAALSSDFPEGAVAAVEKTPVLVTASLQKPPEMDEDTLAMMQEEDWEKEPVYDKQFDPEKRIRELRKGGYNVMKYPVGLTKVERQEFYAKEEEVMKAYAQFSFLERVKRDNASKLGVSSTSATTITSTVDDNVLLPIREEPR